MKKVLNFDGGETSKTVYRSLHDAIRFGRNHLQTAPGRDVLRRERDVRRSLESIGVQDPERAGDVVCGGCGRTVLPKETQARVLKEGGGSITIDQAELELLVERIDKGLWAGDGALGMADALDFLSDAKEPTA